MADGRPIPRHSQVKALCDTIENAVGQENMFRDKVTWAMGDEYSMGLT